MKVLLSNDDGVYAPGIVKLKNQLKNANHIEKCTVVAPLEERSTTGHTLTLDSPLRLSEIEEGVWGCSGYPADCTLMGVGYILKEQKPDLVVSGINRGANLGQDIYYSGTVAAAREATFHGFRSIAVSLVIDLSNPPKKLYFETAAKFTEKLIEADVIQYIAPMSLLNVNVPNLPYDELRGFELTKLGKRIYSENVDERTDFRGKNYFWLEGHFHGNEQIPGSDCMACDEGKVSLCPLDLLGFNPELLPSWAKFAEDFKI